MEFNIDRLINYFDNYSKSRHNTSELSEDEAGSSQSAGGSAPAANQPNEWKSNRAMGVTYMGPDYVWTSNRKEGPTYYYSNPTKPWSSGRKMGATGGSDYPNT